MKYLSNSIKYIKIFISLPLLIAVTIRNIQLTFASSTIGISKMNLNHNITIDESSKIDLYGNHDEVFAQFYKLKDGAICI